MTDREKLNKLIAEIERRKKEVEDNIFELGNFESERIGLFDNKEIYNDLLSFYNSMRKEPKECMYSKDSYTAEDRKTLCDGCEEECKFNKKEEPVSEELEEAAKNHAVERYRATRDMVLAEKCKWSFKAGAEWQKENLWKPADGDDLPEYDREVIVLVKYSTQRNIHDEEYPTYRVGFGHRPNPDGWDGKNIDTNVITHYTPKLYDKGGWNIPNIIYWLDVKLPKE